MGKAYPVKIIEENDGYCVTGQRVVDINEEEKDLCISYRVHDLCDCPEDAIIERDLFCAEDYLEAIELGMKLAQKGYDSINCVYEEEEEY